MSVIVLQSSMPGDKSNKGAAKDVAAKDVATKDAAATSVSMATDDVADVKKISAWVNFNDEYLFPKSFLEHCVMFVQRSGSTLIIRTTDEYNDLTSILPTETEAIAKMKNIHQVFTDESVICKIEFNENSPTEYHA